VVIGPPGIGKSTLIKELTSKYSFIFRQTKNEQEIQKMKEKDELPIIEIEYPEANDWSRKYPYANMIYIFPPSIKEYEKRLVRYRPFYGEEGNWLELDR